ncbi:MAG: PaaI family thioesterase, partial [Lachnospiraceae bacterium]|nr:PaaI family thioesterase [Lachnospiraceae bacterium]
MTNEKAAWMFRKLEENIHKDRSNLNGMIDIRFVSCSVEDRTAEFLFVSEDWERNVFGGIHGGMIATVLDSCMGITSGVYSEKPASTVSMNVQYLQPGTGAEYRVLVSLPHKGRRII